MDNSAVAGLPDWLADTVTRHPALIVAALALLALLVLARGERQSMKDPSRLFTPTMRAIIARRAGGRCEHHYLLLFRCRNRGSEADHIYPHVRGGATALANAQWLCRTHNRVKGSRTPSPWYVASLVRARRHYFPPGTDPTIRR